MDSVLLVTVPDVPDVVEDCCDETAIPEILQQTLLIITSLIITPQIRKC